jgi:hypothetical protein
LNIYIRETVFGVVETKTRDCCDWKSKLLVFVQIKGSAIVHDVRASSEVISSPMVERACSAITTW